MELFREPLEVLEIFFPKCVHSFGVNDGEVGCFSTADSPCWNSDFTCTDILNYDPSNNLVLRFVKNRNYKWVDVEGAFQPAMAIPSLVSVSVSPTELNVASGDPNKSPLGVRNVVSFVINDHPYNDIGIDPNLDDRDYTPEEAQTRGTLWSKLLAMYPYHTNFVVRHYDGYVGQSLDQMIRRTSFIERIERSQDQVRGTAKDIIRRITDTDVTMPELSRGELSLALNDSASTFVAVGALEEEYFPEGYLRIGGELMHYTGRSGVGANVTFTGVTRGVEGTPASSHSQFDRVQKVLYYENEPFQNILYEACVTYAGIDPSFIDKDAWDEEQQDFRTVYLFTGFIPEATLVRLVAGEICQDSLTHIWWDERNSIIMMRAQRPQERAPILTDRDNVIFRSYRETERAEERADDVRVFYKLRTPLSPMTDPLSYLRAVRFIDVDKSRQYGESKVKNLFSRWLPSNPVASAVAQTFLNRFRDTRRDTTIEVDAKDIADFWTGGTMRLEHFSKTDPSGAPEIGTWLITSAEIVIQGLRYRFIAEDDASSGVLWRWQDHTLYPARFEDASPEEKINIPYWTDPEGRDLDGNMTEWRWS